MLKRLKQDKILAAIIIIFIILFFIVSYFILKSSQTKDAVVLKNNTSSGTIITPDMIAVIKVPIETPEGYLRNPQSVVGHKLRTNVKSGQLLYESNFMTSFSDMMDSDKIPEDYVITSISVPNDRAVGGLITAGDYVDVMAVMNAGTNTEAWTGKEITVSDINGEGRTDTEKKVAYILANVYILSKDNDTSQGATQDSKASSSSVSNYAIALSYDDVKKLRQVEGIKDVQLWLNIAPTQNQKEGQKPLLKQMVGQSYSFLHDAQDPVQDKDGNLLMDKYYIPGVGGISQRIESNDKPSSGSLEDQDLDNLDNQDNDGEEDEENEVTENED